MGIKPLPSKIVLDWLFEYNEKQGCLIWKNVTHPNKKRFIGKVAGSISPSDGYFDIRVNGKNYRAHRLIWFLKTGEQPVMIDHINGDILDNRIINLRATSNRLNQGNRHSHRDGRLVGTTWRKDLNKWSSRIIKNGKKCLLGYFNTELEAHQSYLNALKHV